MIRWTYCDCCDADVFRYPGDEIIINNDGCKIIRGGNIVHECFASRSDACGEFEKVEGKL